MQPELGAAVSILLSVNKQKAGSGYPPQGSPPPEPTSSDEDPPPPKVSRPPPEQHLLLRIKQFRCVSLGGGGGGVFMFTPPSAPVESLLLGKWMPAKRSLGQERSPKAC